MTVVSHESNADRRIRIVGSHIVDRLLAGRYEAVVIDHLVPDVSIKRSLRRGAQVSYGVGIGQMFENTNR
jgi:hypothetical protein